MAIQIRAPNGDTIHFPDGTDDSTVTSVMRREYGGPPAPEPAGAKNVRPSSVPRFMSDDPEHDDTGAFFPRPVEPSAPQTGDVLNRDTLLPFVETMGPDGKPQQGVGLPSIISEPIEAADRLISRPAAPGTGDNAQLVPDAATIAMTAIPGGRRMATHETLETIRATQPRPGTVGPPVPQPSMRPTQGPQQPAPAPAPAAAATPDVGQLAQDLGVDMPRAAAGGRTAQILGGSVRELPWIGDPVVDAAKKATTQIEGVVDDVANRLGPSSREGAGLGARDEMASWIRDGSKVATRQAYNDLDTLINPTVTVPLSKLDKAVKDIIARDKISATSDGEAAVKLVGEALSRPQGLTYEGVKGLRSSIFDRLDGTVTGHGISQKHLMRLKSALDEDVRFAVGRAGAAKGGKKRALEAFERANTMHREASQHREALTKIIGTQADASGEAIVDRIRVMASASRGADHARVLQARAALGPQAWEDVAGSVLRSMGRDKEGFSLARWRTDYAKISDEGKNALFGGGHRETLDKVFELGKYGEQLSRMGNPSQTARMGTLAGAPFALAMEPTLVLTTIFGGRMLASALARPITAKATARTMQAAKAHSERPSNATALMLVQAVKQLAATLGQGEAEAEERVRALIAGTP